jgi:hypothetical protein
MACPDPLCFLSSSLVLTCLHYNRVPPNVHFLVDDAAEEDWLYPLNSFDYIHTRMMCGTMEDFREVIKKSFKYLKPGGWMECQVNKRVRALHKGPKDGDAEMIAQFLT